ncbi:trypsin-like peptidase domain-containing protein [Bacillus sp. PS06]|nr:trypsin-like peptidase domain-containing protein [Bacillus sp. PS06]
MRDKDTEPLAEEEVLYEIMDEPKSEAKQERREDYHKKGKLKNIVTTVSAGVVGSLLTLILVPFTDFYGEYVVNVKDRDVSINSETTTNSTQNSSDSLVKATPTSAQATTGSIADIVEKASPAIVGIVNMKQQNNRFSNLSETVESGTGSGVIFEKNDKTAYIVTNNHVVEGANEIEVSLYNGEKVQAELIGADALTDLAVLKISSEHVEATIDFGDSSQLRPGEQVLAIGNPLGLDLSRTVTQGIVSATERTIDVTTSAGAWNLDVIQTDAAINPGNSGGALINTSGQVIGINSLKISNSGVEGLGFAIPSNDVLPIVNEIIKQGYIERPYIGVGLTSLEEIPHFYLQALPEDLNGGVMISNVDPNSAAAAAGLKLQDVIVAINGKEVKNSSELRKYLYTDFKIGDEVEFEIYRGEELMKVSLTLTSNKSNNQ